MANSLHIYIRTKYFIQFAFIESGTRKLLHIKNDNFRLNIIRSVLYLFTKKSGSVWNPIYWQLLPCQLLARNCYGDIVVVQVHCVIVAILNHIFGLKWDVCLNALICVADKVCTLQLLNALESI